MSAISTGPEGRIRIIGKVHGAMNAVVEYGDDPEGWEFKQFISQDQLDAFASANNLSIVENME